jgi:DNA-binding SARP family transcriptional activator
MIIRVFRRTSMRCERSPASAGTRPRSSPASGTSSSAPLALRPGRPVTSDELARHVWPDQPGVNGEDIRRVVYRLRRMIGDDRRRRPLIRNRRGQGYVLQAEPAA